MAKESKTLTLLIKVDKTSKTPISTQIAQNLKKLIFEGLIAEEESLPSLRKLAQFHKVSIGTVKAAYLELFSEGLITSKPRSGFQVAKRKDFSRVAKPDFSLQKPNIRRPDGRVRAAAHFLSSDFASNRINRPFTCFTSSKDEFLTREWTKTAVYLVKATWNHNGYSSPHGLPQLRKIIAERLRQTRAIRCHLDQIILTTGTVQSLSIISNLLLQPGDSIYIEDPSLPIFTDVFSFSGIHPEFAPVDECGLDVGNALESKSPASALLVSPASQYPMSVSLTASRREQLVEWANKTESWIIEDDIDNLLWYDQTPNLPIRSMLNAEKCTIFLDSFTLLVYPGIRLGFMLVPEAFADSFAGAKLLADRQCPESTQALLAKFLESKAYESHLRKIFKLYGSKKKLMDELLTGELADFGKVLPTHCGSHVSFLLNQQFKDSLVSQHLANEGITALPLSVFCKKYLKNGLVLGFTSYSENEIIDGVKKIKAALNHFANK